MEPTEGFEPTTRCLQNSRSDQLSYVGASEWTVSFRKLIVFLLQLLIIPPYNFAKVLQCRTSQN